MVLINAKVIARKLNNKDSANYPKEIKYMYLHFIKVTYIIYQSKQLIYRFESTSFISEE